LKELTITKNDAGQRLDRFLDKALPLLPTSLCQKYIRLKRVKVNGRGSDRDYRLNEGDVLSLYINDEFFERPTEENAYKKVGAPKLDIVYEDENILLADKKIGMLCHSSDKDTGEISKTLIANIQSYLYRKGDWRPREESSFTPALCNRIDRNTGGIVIAAKNAEALRILNQKIRDREIDKYYLCAVHGEIKPPTGRLEGYIFKDSVKNRVYVRQKPEAGAKTALTEYRTLEVRDGLSLLECRLLTGRTHQIRAMLAAAGHPLLGDGKYGGSSKFKQAADFDEKHQALYSWRLTFTFPTDAGCLNYLKGKTVSVKKVDFVEKYFSAEQL
jgi:23S rRNA pseudouridine955/2504/2580 synthase